MSQLDSLVEAVRVIRRSESAHKACQAVASAEKKKSVNIVSTSAEREKISPEIWVLNWNSFLVWMKKFVSWNKKPKRQPLNNVVCFASHEPGHLAQNCPDWSSGPSDSSYQ